MKPDVNQRTLLTSNIFYQQIIMPNASSSALQLIKDDPRYSIDAYVFVREALDYAADALELGSLGVSDDAADDAVDETSISESGSSKMSGQSGERHMTGQQLCEAIRLYALNQFGYMAQVVLGSWGVCTTGAFGDIVYNMINAGLMKKSPEDRRDHFDGVYDFEEVFNRKFEICNAVGTPLNLKGSFGGEAEF